MSGGAWPIVMALMFDDTQNVITGREEGYNSGFKGVFADGTSNTSGKEVPDSKYYDAYQLSNDFYNYSTRILGDATGELGPFTTHYYAEVNLTRIVSSWYYADARFLSESYPLFGRGGSMMDGTGAGIGYFFSQTVESVNSTFQIVLTP